MALDENDKTTIGELIGEALKANNAELSKQFATPDAVGKMLKQSFADLKLDEKIVEVVGKLKPADEPGDDADEGGKGKGGKTDPEVARLRAEIKAIEARAKKAEDERKAAEEKAKADRLHQAARDALAEAGVPADRMRPALATLKDEGLLAYDDDGNPGFRFQRQGYAEVLTGKDGAAEWLKSDTAKLFLPPADVGGTGDRSGRRTQAPNSGQPVSAETLASSLFSRALGG